MGIVDEIVQGVVDGVMREVRSKRARRRRRLTPTERLRRIEKLLKPARQHTSRKKTTRTRSAAQQKRLRTKTRRLTRSLRTGKARR
jgi:hypothetical protein